MNANHSLALQERAARQREDEREKSAVAERLVIAMRVPPTTRRAAAQFQADVDLWRYWCERGEAPELPQRVKLPAKARKKPKIKTIKAGPGFDRSTEWQQRGVPKRRQRAVIYTELQLGSGFDVAMVNGMPTAVPTGDAENIY